MSPAVALGGVAICLGEPLVTVWLLIIHSRTPSRAPGCRQPGHHDGHGALPQPRTKIVSISHFTRVPAFVERRGTADLNLLARCPETCIRRSFPAALGTAANTHGLAAGSP